MDLHRLKILMNFSKAPRPPYSRKASKASVILYRCPHRALPKMPTTRGFAGFSGFTPFSYFFGFYPLQGAGGGAFLVSCEFLLACKMPTHTQEDQPTTRTKKP
jgi:hypothetical protein